MDLKELRERKGFTQKQIADKLGVRPHTVSAWERGINALPEDQRNKIAEVFDVDPNEIEAPIPQVAMPRSDYRNTPGAEMMRLIFRINERPEAKGLTEAEMFLIKLLNAHLVSTVYGREDLPESVMDSVDNSLRSLMDLYLWETRKLRNDKRRRKEMKEYNMTPEEAYNIIAECMDELRAYRAYCENDVVEKGEIEAQTLMYIAFKTLEKRLGTEEEEIEIRMEVGEK